MKNKFLLGNAALDRMNDLPKETREDCLAKMKEAAEIKDSVSRDALVIPRSTGSPSAGMPPASSI